MSLPSEIQAGEESGNMAFDRQPVVILLICAIPMLLQLVGLEVVGGDPDRFFRPLKSELVRQLSSGQIPLWSDLFGFGMPMAGQSEIGAFYLPHYLIYGLFGVGRGYRISMVLHQCLGGLLIYRLARILGAVPLGASLSVCLYLFGGFPTIQASKEWAVLGMAWMPGAFLGVELWLRQKSRRGLMQTSVALASLALIGHFQIAQITSLGLLLWVVIRSLFQPRLVTLWPGLLLAVGLSIGMALPQLLLSWDYAQSVEATSRPFETLAYYSYPLWSFTELIFPLWTRLLAGGPEGAYWTIHQTTQFEACQYFGSIALLFSILGLLRKNTRPASLSLAILAVVSIFLSTLPQWSPPLYALILQIPGMGLFRCPSRYGLILHFVVALLAALGFGEKVSGKWFFIVLFIITVLSVALWQIYSKGFSISGRNFPASFPITPVLSQAIGCFGLSLLLVIKSGYLCRYALISAIFATFEIIGLYYAGPTQWGWSLNLPQSSALLSNFDGSNKEVALAGPLDNLPVTAGIRTLSPYFGVNMPPPNSFLKGIAEGASAADRQNRPNAYDSSLKALGATHLVTTSQPTPFTSFTADPLAKVILPEKLQARPIFLHSLQTGQTTIPMATRIPQLPKLAASGEIAFQNAIITDQDTEPTAWISQSDLQTWDYPEFSVVDSQAIVEESPNRLVVSHQKPVIIQIRRTFDSGWQVRTPDKKLPVYLRPINGGMTGLFLNAAITDQPDTTVVELFYWPQSLNYAMPISMACFIAMIYICQPKRPIIRRPS